MGLGLILLGLFGVFFKLCFFKQKHYKVLQMLQSSRGKVNVDLYLESSKATCMSLMMMMKLFPVP